MANVSLIESATIGSRSPNSDYAISFTFTAGLQNREKKKIKKNPLMVLAGYQSLHCYYEMFVLLLFASPLALLPLACCSELWKEESGEFSVGSAFEVETRA